MTIWCVRGRSVAILNDIVRLGHAVTIISRAASAVLRTDKAGKPVQGAK